jgi:transcriptional regulator with XRE-family HTH domain
LGERVRLARKRRGWSQRELAELVDLTPSRVGQLELGRGVGASLEVWHALGEALDVQFAAGFRRDAIEDTADAGHLRMQELILRLGRETRRQRALVLPTRPLDPALSTDVCLADDRLRVLFQLECWNTFGSINASVRSTRRKIADAQALAVAIGAEGGAYRVAACWIVRDTRRNREIVGRYPEVFAATFTGSSARWLQALTTAEVRPPNELGLVWCDLNATRLFPRRYQAALGGTARASP